MTVIKLHKLLAALIAQGHGRKPVHIDKPTFRDNCESDGCVILPVCALDLRWINETDGDGGIVTNADGTERGRMTLVLGGSSYSYSDSGEGNARTG